MTRTADPSHADARSFLAGGSEMARLVREKDWSATPLGPIERWPQSLRTTVSLCLASNFPINIIWGAQHTQIYNDGYRIVCGDAHPRALGESYRDTWASAWPAIGGPFETALAGNTSYLENQRMFLTRNGYLEETFFTFSLSPIRDESGGIGGLFHPVTETTATMLAERRTRALRDLTGQLAAAGELGELVRMTMATLAVYEFDLPFALFYTRVDDHSYQLAGHYGLSPDTPASPQTLPSDGSTPWPVTEALRSGKIVDVENVAERLRGAPCGPYDEPSASAFLLPIIAHGGLTPALVVLGASPRLPLTGDYRTFFELIGAALTAALNTVRAREDERRRAEALAEIDRAKTVFFSNVSHEFRTPLTLMLGPLEDLQSNTEALTPQDRDRVELAHRNALRLLKLVNTLLDFSRLEAGRLQATYQPTNLAEFTAELASTFRSALERAGLRLVIDAPPLQSPVNIDRDMWEKIVLNLLSNAFKFTFEGEVRVQVRAGEDGRDVTVSVADTGTGIPAAAMPKLFDRFHRVEGAKGRSFEGSGIGLAMVQELVKLNGGTIDVESVEGVGSTFSVTLPLLGVHELEQTPVTLSSTATRASAYVEEALGWLPNARESQTSCATAPVHGRVLLADDNADMRAYVERLLVAEGFVVEAVADGEAALSAARVERPDLLISDVMMPRLDGFGLLQAVRSDAQLSDIPFIMLSARAGEEARVEGLKAGADEYLTKPFSARELVARVRTSLNLARERESHRMSELNEILEHKIAERSAELSHAHEALRQAQKMEAMGRLTGGVAHDFNNLLTPILSTLDTLQRRNVWTPREQRLVAGALECADRAKTLVHRLLAFARRQPLQPTAVSVATVVGGMASILASTGGPRVRIVVDIEPDLPPAHADASQLEMALLNLAVNSRDAMPQGGELRIAVTQRAVRPGERPDLEPGDYICLAVADTGTGMDQDTLNRSIEPFFSTKGVGKGTGLGLSMVHGLAMQLKGSLDLTSTPGSGTRVELWLPVSRQDIAALADASLETLGAQVVARTALVVDDEDLVRLSTADMLVDLGYSVAEASSAQHALTLIDQGLQPDLLVTDHLMPGMTGTELARALRVSQPGLQVLIVSGFAEVEGIAWDFPRLAKPYRNADLARMLSKLTAQAE